MRTPITKTDKSSSSRMMCPVCREALVMSERQNIEIDYCPECRGVWLDRGELDKIVERSVKVENTAQPDNDREYRKSRDHRDDRDDRYRGGHHGRGSRRKSWLEEIFH